MARELGWTGIHRDARGRAVGSPPGVLTFAPVPLPKWSSVDHCLDIEVFLHENSLTLEYVRELRSLVGLAGPTTDETAFALVHASADQRFRAALAVLRAARSRR
jgi:hypothetical protein